MAIPIPSSQVIRSMSTTYPTVPLVDRCTNLRQLKEIHGQMLRTGLFFDPFSASKLIQASAISEFSSLDYALKVFNQIPEPNIYSWNFLIRAYASSPERIDTLLMFVRCLHECREMPNEFTYPFVFKASAKLADLRFGSGVHGMTVKNGFSSDIFVRNCLVHFYAECGCLDIADRIFMSMEGRDVVSWNSIINGLAQNGRADQALEYFRRMEGEGVKPNDVTMVGVLSACGKNLDLELGKRMHSFIETNGVMRSLILDNTIIDMYTKCGSIKDARRCFDEMAEKDVISWTSMVAGYGNIGDFGAARDLFQLAPTENIALWNALISAYEENGHPIEAVATFNELQLSNAAEPDEVTLVSTLSACSQLGALDLGRWIHVYLKKKGLTLNRYLVTALIDMYSKCGDLQKALEVFYSAEKRDVFVWSAMIAGFAMHGLGREAIELFMKMQEAKVKPSSVTFTNLLSACNHSGLVEEGIEYFNQMEPVYKIEPIVEQYTCMIDILGRAGRILEAVELIKSMPIALSASVWGALLGACRLHRNIDLAEHAFNKLISIEPQNHGAYVLLSNTYANSGKWDRVSELRKLMKDAGMKKEPGCSSIEVNGTVHEFRVGDNRHPMSKKICLKLDEIEKKLINVGYVSNKSQVLQLVEDEDMQEKALYLHSERLAIAYGLIALSPSQPIRVMKNLRVCEDCHSVTKLISKFYDREIVLRDRYRFHHFKGGSCSCMDYW